MSETQTLNNAADKKKIIIKGTSFVFVNAILTILNSKKYFTAIPHGGPFDDPSTQT